ncbi:MAG: hypothetical protein Q9209_001284 [Squamulea sp. 1 TL-2023]
MDSLGSSTPLEENSPARDVHGWKWTIVVASVLSSTFLFALDNTIVVNVQPAIYECFLEIETLLWLGVSFALGSAATILPWCKAYSVFNIKWLYIFHVLLFEAGSALCGGANIMDALIVGRAIAGNGGCGIIDFQSGVPLKTKIVKMTDWLGIVVFNAFMICFAMAVNFGGTFNKWKSGPEITFWVLGGVLFVTFYFTQAYHPFVEALHKLYPTHLMRRPVLIFK